MALKLSLVLDKKNPVQTNHTFEQREVLLSKIDLLTLLMVKISNTRTYNKWDKVFKSGWSKFCGRHSLKNLKGYGLLKQRSVQPPPPSTFLLGWSSLRPNFQKKRGGFAGSQFLEGAAWKEEGDFFQGACSFLITNKLKSEIFNGKKVYKQKCFSLS